MNEKTMREMQNNVIESEVKYLTNRIDYYCDALADKRDAYAFRQDRDPDYYDKAIEDKIAYYDDAQKLMTALRAAIMKIDVIGQVIKGA